MAFRSFAGFGIPVAGSRLHPAPDTRRLQTGANAPYRAILILPAVFII
jgi:hypothetical protein